MELSNPWSAAETEAYFGVFSRAMSGNTLSSEDQTLLQGCMRKSDFMPFLLSTLVTSDRNSTLSPEHARMLALVFPKHFDKMEDLEEKMKIVESIFSVTLFYYDGLDPEVQDNHFRTTDLLANLVADIIKSFKHERMNACLRQFVRQLVSFKEFYLPIELLFVIIKQQERADILEILVEAFEDAAEANTLLQSPYVQYSLYAPLEVRELLLKETNRELLNRWRALCITAASQPCPQSITSNEVSNANQVRLYALSLFGHTGDMCDLSRDHFQRLYAFFEMHNESITDKLRLLYVAAFASKIVCTAATVDQAIFLIRNVFLPIMSWSQKQESMLEENDLLFSAMLFPAGLKEFGIENGDRFYYRLRVLVVHWCAKRPELRGPVMTVINEILSSKDNDCLKFAALRLFGGLAYLLATDSPDLENSVMEMVDARILPLLEAPSTPHFCKFRALGVLGRVIQNYFLSSQQSSRSYDAIIRCFQEETNTLPQKLFCCVAMKELLEKGKNHDLAEKFRKEVLAEFTNFALLYRVDIEALRSCVEYFLESCKWNEDSGRSLVRALVDHCNDLVNSDDVLMEYKLQGELSNSIGSLDIVFSALGLKQQDIVISTLPTLTGIFTKRLTSLYEESLRLLFTGLQAVEQPDHPAFITLFDAIVAQDHSSYVDTEDKILDMIFLAYGSKKILNASSLSNLVSFCSRTVNAKEWPTWLENCLYALHSILCRLESTNVDLKSLFNILIANFKRGEALGMVIAVLTDIIRITPSLLQAVPSTFWEFILLSDVMDNQVTCECLVEALSPHIKNGLRNEKLIEIFSKALIVISSTNGVSSEVDQVDDDQQEVESQEDSSENAQIELVSQYFNSDDESGGGAYEPDITEIDIAVSA